MKLVFPEPEFPPQGALRQKDGSVLWCVWAPHARSVALVTWPDGQRAEVEMTFGEWGYFTHRQHAVEDGLRYAYRLDGGSERPDPASRWQPDGVHRPSAVFSPESFSWSDGSWRGIPQEELVIYELHVGTFTSEGTFAAVIDRLGELRELGVTAIEIMPVSQFPGERNWGYDGVHPYAAQNSYGGPRELQRLVDAAHRAGMAVILDVVYNHFGPEGNYVAEFGPYFTDRYHTPWGPAVNYDGPRSDPVRRFAVDNACMWVRDFHVDGLRLDAVQTIYDFGARHILADIQDAVQQVARAARRTVHVIAETNQNDVRLIDSPENGGYGLDGVWSDDFHHSVHALLAGERDGYFVAFGEPEHVAKAYTDVFVYDGCYSPFHRRRFGSPVHDADRMKFVVCLKNHDQVGNRAQGDRPATYLSAAAQRLTCGLLLISPCVPLIFMGEEYGETHPFPFFCSFEDAALVEAVRQGRRREFEELDFQWGADIPDPQSPETFASAVLSWSWLEGSRQGHLRQLYQTLLKARREWPALRDRRHTRTRLVSGPPAESASTPPSVLVIERGDDPRVTAWANIGHEAVIVEEFGLLRKSLLLTTEDERFGGTAAQELDDQSAGRIEQLQPCELALFAGQ